MSTRYYNPEVGRFLNADVYASTGHGLIGSNMFAYCNNNAVNASDSLGSKPVSILEREGDKKIPVPPRRNSKKNKKNNKPGKKNKDPQKQKNVMDQWEEMGVTYKSRGPGKGGKIINSYLIDDYQEMYEYADYLVNESEYRDDFTGSVEGVVYEWDVHNFLYNHGPSKWKNNAKDVDLGRTIFSDPHKGLNAVMWFGYYMTYPDQYYSDLFS